MTFAHRFRRSAVTLIEVVIATAILATLVGLILPAVQSTRGVAARVKCQDNLKQLALAAHTAHDAAGNLPSTPKWQFELCEYLGQPKADVRLTLPILVCPGDPRGPVRYTNAIGVTTGLTWYVGLGSLKNSQGDGLIVPTSSPRINLGRVPDGISNTILAGERPPPPNLYYGFWRGNSIRDTFAGAAETIPIFNSSTNAMAGTPCPFPARFRPGHVADYCSFHSVWSPHSGGGNFAFGDGSVRFLSHRVAAPIDDGPSILEAMITRAGGESPVASW